MNIKNKYDYLPDCSSVRVQVGLYSIPEAIARWCGVKEADLNKFMTEMTHAGKGIYKHEAVPCVFYKSQAIHNAIEEKKLIPVREYGGTPNPNDHVAADRRHFYGKDLKEWILSTFPDEKPEFLFSELERNRYQGFTISEYQTILAENNRLKQENEDFKARVEKARELYRELKLENDQLKKEKEQAFDFPSCNKSSLLQFAIEAFKRFWITADFSQSDTYPKKEEVANWLVKEKKVNATKAEQIAEIIRPDNAPMGRRREE